MTDEDGFRIEAALQLGFEWTNDDATEYRCTEAQLIAFAKACERKGLAEAATITAGELWNVSLLMSNPPQSSAAWDTRNAINKKVEAIDAELAPVLEAERQRYLSEEVPQISDNECCDLAAVEPCPDCPAAQKFCLCGVCVELCPSPDGKPLCEESDKTTQISDCEVCGGDCAAANPPVINCPNQRLV